MVLLLIIFIGLIIAFLLGNKYFLYWLGFCEVIFIISVISSIMNDLTVMPTLFAITHVGLFIAGGVIYLFGPSNS